MTKCRDLCTGDRDGVVTNNCRRHKPRAMILLASVAMNCRINGQNLDRVDLMSQELQSDSGMIESVCHASSCKLASVSYRTPATEQLRQTASKRRRRD